jgi:TetR/AcrR family transcriptional regulator, regulator of autoinduction and epiphytic fitness
MTAVAPAVAPPRAARSKPLAPGADAARGDGRLMRGERTRRAVAEALIALLEEGELQPTARAVATRAGVSPRLVFHHFADMESILRAAVTVQAQRHWRGLSPVDPALPLPERVRRLVRQRVRLFEAVGPVRRAALQMEQSSAVISAELHHSRRSLRQQLVHAFSPELERAGGHRGRVLDALEVAAGFESFEQLRRGMKLGPAAAGRVMADLMGAVLQGVDDGGGRR